MRLPLISLCYSIKLFNQLSINQSTIFRNALFTNTFMQYSSDITDLEENLAKISLNKSEKKDTKTKSNKKKEIKGKKGCFHLFLQIIYVC